MEQMRIQLIYLGRRGSGGAITVELASALKMYAEVRTMVSSQAENITIWENSSLPFTPVATYQTPQQALTSLIWQSGIKNVGKAVREFKPDVIIFPMFHPWNPYIQQICKDIPSITFVHDPIPHPGFTGWVYSKFEDRVIHQASRCAILSQNLKAATISRGAKPENIIVFPHGALTYYQTYFPPINPQDLSEPNILFFGRITPYKGLEVLLQAYQQMDPKTRPPLSIVGEGDIKPYQFLIQSIGGIRVINHWISDAEIPQYFRANTIVVLPYTSASQSGVLEIATGYGLPVIATRVGGIPEQLRDGETGLLVDSQNPGQIKNALEKLLANPSLARQLGQQLKITSLTDRSWEKTAEKLFTECTTLTSQHYQAGSC